MKTPDFCLNFRVFERASCLNTKYGKEESLVRRTAYIKWGPSQNRATNLLWVPEEKWNVCEKTCEHSAIISCYFQQEILIESVFLSHIIHVVYTPSEVLRPYCYYFVVTSPWVSLLVAGSVGCHSTCGKCKEYSRIDFCSEKPSKSLQNTLFYALVSIICGGKPPTS